jgi:hypothetical protein
MMRPEVVVPGHGDPGGMEIIKSMREYIEDLESIVKEMRDSGASIKDIENVAVPDKYKDWILPDYFYTNLEVLCNMLASP